MKTKVNGNTALGRVCNRALDLGRAASAAADAYSEARSLAVVEIAKAGVVLRRGDALLLSHGEISGRDKVNTSVDPLDVEVALEEADLTISGAIRRGILKVDLATLLKACPDIKVTEQRDIGVPVFSPTPVADKAKRVA